MTRNKHNEKEDQHERNQQYLNIVMDTHIRVDLSIYVPLRRLPLLKLANSHYFPLTPFARFIRSLMRF